MLGPVSDHRITPALLGLVTLSAIAQSSCSSGEGLPIVINEVHTDPIEFVEIMNIGDETVSLVDVTLTDSDAEGDPLVADRAPLPEIGLEPGERLVMLLGQEVSDGMLRTGTTECVLVGLRDCVHVAFRLRSAEGETVYLQRRGRVIDFVEIPPVATEPEETYCRQPDGTGEFEACDASPGEVNP